MRFVGSKAWVDETRVRERLDGWMGGAIDGWMDGWMKQRYKSKKSP